MFSNFTGMTGWSILATLKPLLNMLCCLQQSWKLCFFKQFFAGWEPLCKFLDLPVPDIPFPRVNDSASMKSMVDNVERAAW